MKKLSLILLALGASFLGLFGQSSQVFADQKIEVVTTFYPVYEFTKAVVGNEGKVNLLIKAGTEVHDFEPSTKDIAKISDADAFVYADDNMETWVTSLKKTLGKKKTNFIKSTGNMLLLPGTQEDDHDHEGEGHHHQYDPHVWLAPRLAIKQVEEIRQQLSKQYPDKKATFETNASAYIKKLETLDKEFKEGLTNAKQKSFVTQHAAFSYLALDYGLTQVPITGVTAESEPSSKRLSQLSKYIKANGINYIYFEENASVKVAKTLADEAGVKTAVLNPLESLTQRQMKQGEDYFSVMRTNLKHLKKTTDVAGKAIQPEKAAEKTVYNGYFKDKAVKARSLADWSGQWQSVYPYLQDGTFDPIWDYKAKLKKDMSAKDYKAYYTTGYQTDVDKIAIDGKKKTMTFMRNGKKHTYTYEYVGHKILNYKKGNRGVRFLFETKAKDAGEFKYVQFSDHGIAPAKAGHFHLYWGGESQKKLLEELEHWPTYYPEKLSGHAIAQEMLAH